MVIGEANKQSYVIRGEIVELCKQKMNPYILCYRRRPSETAKQKLAMVKDDIESKREKQYQLPDFWSLFKLRIRTLVQQELYKRYKF